MPALILSASRSSQCYSEARAAFNRTYSKTNFFIDGTNGGVLDYNKQIVRIKNFNVIQNVLNNFGDMIQFINISFAEINQVKGSEIVHCITVNSSDSLKELYLNHCHGQVLDQMNRPFRNVAIASFSTHLNDKFEIGLSALKLNKLFPNLRRLHVKVGDIDDLKFVGDKFSALRSLIIDLPEQETLSLSSIEQLFKGNPKVNSLTIYRCSLKVLRIASRLLPNLKVLRLFGFADDFYQGNQIHFKNVYHLDVTSTRHRKLIPEMLVFHQLRKLSLNIDFGFTDHWGNFFINQVSKSIEVVDIKTKSFTSNQLLLTIAEHLPNVKVATISSEQKISADAIIELLSKCEQLLSLQMQVALIDVAERKHLDESLQHEWDISLTYRSINVMALTFSRLINSE